MQFFRRFWDRLFGKDADQPGLIGREEKYYESFFGKENQLTETRGRDQYTSKVYDTDKYFIQLIFNKSKAIVKNYIDKFESINFQEFQNLIRSNFKYFDPRFIGYNLSANQIVQINAEMDKAIILNHSEIVPVPGEGYTGTYPLKSVLFVIDKDILDFLINSFNAGRKIR